jgi:hypothetical protein
MTVQLQAIRDTDNAILAKSYYNESDDQARATAIIQLIEDIIAGVPDGEDLPAFTLSVAKLRSVEPLRACA